MAFWNDFPYTNFHEQNQDWMLRTIKQLVEDFEKVSGGFKDIQKEFQSFKDFVFTQIQGLDFYPAVSKKIDEMIADGSFFSLLLSANVKYPLEFKRVFRLHVDTMPYGDSSLPIKGFQGIAIDGAGNFYVSATTTTVEEDVDGMSVGFLYKTNANGTIMQINNNATIGHGNNLAYYPEQNVLLCANLHGKLTVWSTSLELVKTIELEGITNFSVSYNYQDKKIYIISGRNVCALDYASGKLTVVRAITIEGWDTIQNYSLQGKYIYSVDSAPNSYGKFDGRTGRPVYIQTFGENIDIWKAGELESMCFDANGNIYLLSYVKYNGKLIAHIFKSNLLYSIQGSDVVGSNNPINVMIDNTVGVTNPDGSVSKPFASLEDAFTMEYPIYGYTFAKKCDCSNEYLFLNGRSCIVIDLKDSVFGGAQITACSGLKLIKANIDNKNITKPVYARAPFNVYRSDAIIDGIKVSATKETEMCVQANTVNLTITNSDFLSGIVGTVTNTLFNLEVGFISASESFCRGIRTDKEAGCTTPARATVKVADGVIEAENGNWGFLRGRFGKGVLFCKLNDGKTIVMTKLLTGKRNIWTSDDGTITFTFDDDFTHFTVAGLNEKNITQIYAV